MEPGGAEIHIPNLGSVEARAPDLEVRSSVQTHKLGELRGRK